MMQNIEIKYRIADPERVAQRLTSIREIKVQFRHYQKDIYFDAPEGRWKIRLEENSRPFLIRYYRPDEDKPRISDYTLTPLPDLKETYADLKTNYGVLAEVEKIRELYLYKNVRIHLDEVTGLGWFLELESVISERYDQRVSQQHLQEVLGILGGLLDEAERGSYLDLLRSQQYLAG